MSESSCEINAKKRSLKSKVKSFFKKFWRMRESSPYESIINRALSKQDIADKVDNEEKRLLENIFEFARLKVSDLMIPRPDISAIADDIDLATLKKIILATRYSRYPVYQKSLDNIVGFINAKDILPFAFGNKNFSVAKVLRKLLIVPPSMRVKDLLIEMRASKIHMAAVVDEYGGTDGLITLDNLLEEIVGEINDEYDNETPIITRLDHYQFRVDAKVGIEELETILEVNLSENVGGEEEFETLAGLILSLTGYIPLKGEVIKHPNGVTFEILESDPRRVKLVLVNIKSTKVNLE